MTSPANTCTSPALEGWVFYKMSPTLDGRSRGGQASEYKENLFATYASNTLSLSFFARSFARSANFALEPWCLDFAGDRWGLDFAGDRSGMNFLFFALSVPAVPAASPSGVLCFFLVGVTAWSSKASCGPSPRLFRLVPRCNTTSNYGTPFRWTAPRKKDAELSCNTFEQQQV